MCLYEKEKESRENGKLKVVGMFKIFMNFQLNIIELNKWRVTSKLSLQLSDSDKGYCC